METLNLNQDDLCHHVATFGIDIYPPVEIPNERTRLNMFYEEASRRWEGLYERIEASSTEFKISKTFRARAGAGGGSQPFDTFILTSRGPVFQFPLILPDPVGDTGLGKDYVQKFQQVRNLFLSALPDRKIMRVGLIRDLVFGTGALSTHGMLTSQASFAGTDLVGGKCRFSHRDPKCNVHVELEAVDLMKTTQLPVGTRVTESAGHGLRVQLDVNNAEIRELKDADIEEVLERATSLWPGELLEYLSERRAL